MGIFLVLRERRLLDGVGPGFYGRRVVRDDGLMVWAGGEMGGGGREGGRGCGCWLLGDVEDGEEGGLVLGEVVCLSGMRGWGSLVS